MKTILKNTVTALFIIVTLFASYSCDGDDEDSPNYEECNYQGLAYQDTVNNIGIFAEETNLSTELFLNGTTTGVPDLEIYGNATTGEFTVFTTSHVTLNASGGSSIIIAGTTYPITVTCLRAGTSVGDEFRFNITGNGINGEYCVVIDTVIP